MAETPNYHVNLWPEPPGPPTYLCLVLECTYKDATLADMLLHTVEAHGLTAVPTPMAANATLIPTPVSPEEAPHASEPDVPHRDEP